MSRVEFRFPILGLYKGAAIDKQPPNTSGHLKNVRPYDVLGTRLRGGPRPGLDKRFSTQIGGQSLPVVAIAEVAVIT